MCKEFYSPYLEDIYLRMSDFLKNARVFEFIMSTEWDPRDDKVDPAVYSCKNQFFEQYCQQ